ncbi:MAG: HEAT repeat domain-containing protein [Deltaproteobacteria bacterium]|nr:HEAT repeat domain-containing protein [Deltaproteobacteria bacterium]
MKKLALVLALLALAAACAKKPDSPQLPSSPLQPESGQQQANTQAPGSQRPSGHWQLVELHVDLQLEEGQRLSAVTSASLDAALQAAAQKTEQVRGFGPSPVVTRLDQAGVSVQIAWQRLDGDLRPVPLDHKQNGQLLIQVVAHAETPGERPSENRVAERSQRVMLPMPGALDDPAAWIQERATRAMVLALSDALGELWAGSASEAELEAYLDGETWQVQAACREIGERKLGKHRSRLEKLAKDTRKDLAAVCAAALGRLGDTASLPVLQSLLASGQPEVVDAALVALAGMAGPEARAIVSDTAEHHANSLVRRRAAQLLSNAVAPAGEVSAVTATGP